MDKKEAKKILKIIVLFYLASFLIINWNDISWVFNYREVWGLVSDFFNPYPSIDASSLNAYFYPNHSVDSKDSKQVSQLAEEVKTSYTDKQSVLEIPRISLSAPIVFSQSSNRDDIMEDLDSGVVYYPGSVYPGQVGQIIILGHSAPSGWPKAKYDWVFTDLEKLSVGDLVYIDLNNKQYTYVVRQKNIVGRGAEVPGQPADSKKNTLILISCWPPGKDYQRIAVQAELQ